MIEETAISQLRSDIKPLMSEKRYDHTIGVMQMAKTLGSFCLEDMIPELICAALLHDVAKEVCDDELMSIIRESYVDHERIISYGEEVWHSYAAPYVVKRDFPSFATPNILSSIQKHTVGSSDMSIFDQIIFIADYIELGRTYPSCIAVRGYLLGSLKHGATEENIIALHKACIMSIEYTVKSLLQRGKSVCAESLQAKYALEAKIK